MGRGLRKHHDSTLVRQYNPQLLRVKGCFFLFSPPTASFSLVDILSGSIVYLNAEPSRLKRRPKQKKIGQKTNFFFGSIFNILDIVFERSIVRRFECFRGNTTYVDYLFFYLLRLLPDSIGLHLAHLPSAAVVQPIPYPDRLR